MNMFQFWVSDTFLKAAPEIPSIEEAFVSENILPVVVGPTGRQNQGNNMVVPGIAATTEEGDAASPSRQYQVGYNLNSNKTLSGAQQAHSSNSNGNGHVN